MKKVLFLTGAGLAKTWGGKSTDEITKALTEKNQVYNTIYQILSTNKKEPNFEEIIYSIELLFQYHYTQQYGLTNNNLFVLPKVFDVSAAIENKLKSFYEESGLEDESQFYYTLFIDAIQAIRNLIIEYSWCLNEKNELNKKFEYFLKSLNYSHTIRCYTTNYDKLFVDVIKKIKFFDGFGIKKTDSFSREYRSQYLISVLNDRDCNCHYNIHGSAFWDFPFGRNEDLAQFDQISPVIEPNFKSKKQLFTSNPNDFQLNSPIITGFNKTQRAFQEPFNSFFNSFYHDCFSTDIWYIIGYSFSDPHINNALKTAFYNRKTKPSKVIWITKNKEHKNYLSHTFCNLAFRELFPKPIHSEVKDFNNPSDYFFHSPDSRVFIYLDGFDRFLNEKIWQKII